MQAVEATTDTGTGRTSATTSRHQRRSRSSYRYRSKIRNYQYLITGILILFLLTCIFTLFWISGEKASHQQTTLEMRKLESRLETVTAELDKVRSERDIMVEGRIPNLSPLKFDEALNISDDFIRNVIFTLVKNGNKKVYEYRLVLSNDGLSVIRPEIEIFLFNELGIQIGNAKVEAANATTNVDRSTLEPGEVRSYSDTIDMLRQGKPGYYLIIASNREKPKGEKIRQHLGEVIRP